VSAALVTCVTHGVHRDYLAARELAEQGYHVIVGAPRRDAAEILAARLRTEGFPASPLRLDLDEVDTFPVIAAELRERFGRIATVVSAAAPGREAGLLAALEPSAATRTVAAAV
jgi:NAD(P)-dependent dehydrogenase (short-subunit alcohol dehydrogenase family)